MNLDQDERTTEEIKILLKKNLVLSEENNRMLRSLRNTARFHEIVRVIYFIIIVGGLVWSYHFLQPYLEQIKGTYTSYQESQSKFTEVFNKFLPGKN